MKKLILTILFLSGCATTETSGREYSCTSFNQHGTYARYKIVASSLAEAQEISTQINQKLVEKQLLPQTDLFCE